MGDGHGVTMVTACERFVGAADFEKAQFRDPRVRRARREKSRIYNCANMKSNCSF